MDSRRRIVLPVDRVGLTLVEMLVAVMIFATLALSLYTTFDNGLRLHRQAGALAGIDRQQRWLTEAVSNDLNNVVPYSFRPSASGQDRRPAFIGRPESMTMVISTDTGLREVRYFLRSPGRGAITATVIGSRHARPANGVVRFIEHAEPLVSLVREERPVTPLGDDRLGGRISVQVLSDDVKESSLRLAYAARPVASGVGPQWLPTWTRTGLPAAVRVEVVLIDRDDPSLRLTIDRRIAVPVSLWGRGRE